MANEILGSPCRHQPDINSQPIGQQSSPLGRNRWRIVLLKHHCGLSHGAEILPDDSANGSRLEYKRSFENESNTVSAKSLDCCRKYTQRGNQWAPHGIIISFWPP
jgi:hypothetical protein